MTALNIGLKHRVSPFEFKFENTDEGPKTSTKGSFQRDARVVVEQRVDEQCSDKYKGGNFNAMRASWTSRTWTSRERSRACREEGENIHVYKYTDAWWGRAANPHAKQSRNMNEQARTRDLLQDI